MRILRINLAFTLVFCPFNRASCSIDISIHGVAVNPVPVDKVIAVGRFVFVAEAIDSGLSGIRCVLQPLETAFKWGSATRTPLRVHPSFVNISHIMLSPVVIP
jgi:hypothetical protein